MGDSKKDLLNDFVIESRDNLAEIEPDLLELEKKGSGDPEIVNGIFRAIHSIKGASGFFDLENINKLSHIMENLLMLVRDGEMKTSSELIDVLLAGVDKLKVMIDDIDSSNDYDIFNELDMLTKMLPGNDKLRHQKTDVEEEPEKNEEEIVFNLPDQLVLSDEDFNTFSNKGQKLYAVVIDYANASFAQDITPEYLENEANSVGEMVKSYPKIEDDNKTSQQGVFAFLINTVLEEDLVAMALGIPDECVKLYSDIKDSLVIPETEQKEEMQTENEKIEHENIINHPASSAKKDPASKKGSSSNETRETIRVNVGLLNNLMNLAGELVLGRNQLMQILSDQVNHFKGLNGVLQNLNLITGELQETIMQTRMQPVGRIFDKFPRILRDLSKKLDKDIELEMSGNDVELDKSIIEALYNPLTHLIRNTADHGIENREDRESAGKPIKGRVFLRAYHEAGLVNIEIIDDGKGMDPNVLKSIAIDKGVISSEQAEKLTDREAFALIFMPGFSTAKEITDVSGRGVGMDVVKTNIEKLGGTVEIESTLGTGTRVNLRLPLTLAIISSMIVRVGDERFAIPQINIEKVVRIRTHDLAKSIQIINGSEILRLRDSLIPLVKLSNLLDVNESEDFHRKPRTILVLKALNNRFGLYVDKVLDNEEIVVKPLSNFMKDNNIYAGATIMGDGEVATILDAQGIALGATLKFSELQQQNELLRREMAFSESQELQSIVLFNNGGDETFSIPLEMIKRIEKIERKEIERIGSNEFIKYLGNSLRLMRLDHYLPVSGPEYDNDYFYLIIPNILSRSAGIVANEIIDVTETAIDVNTKNNQSKGILGSAIIQNKITLLLDVFELLEELDYQQFGSYIDELEFINGSKALLVEDTAFLREMNKHNLSSAGLLVDTAKSGDKAIEMLAVNEYDIVLTDLKLNDMDGSELQKQIRLHLGLEKLKVIGLYSSDSEKNKLKNQSLAALVKKTDKVDILRAINKLIEMDKNYISTGAA